jgi:cytosine/adenosine deaminase-related metal-dependent hydrolase
VFVNAHTHLYSGLAPLGMPPPEVPPSDFVQILERIWWRLDRALDEPSLRAAARYYLAHARGADTAVVVDHHESPSFIEGSLDVLAEACVEAGVAGVLCYGATERNGGRDEARRGLAECRRFVLSNRRPRVAGVVGLHASFTVSDETIREAGALCRDLGTVLHVHVAEDRADVDDARRRGYGGPLERLIALGALPPGSILAHGVHLSAEQVRRVSDAGCWLVQNPRSNRNNRVGYAASLGFAAKVALGTDGFASDMRDEARALAEEARTAGDDPAAVAGRLDAGWRLAAERLGLARLPRRSPAGVRAATSGEGGPADGPAGVAPGVLDSIEREARAEAARLWRRW